MCVRSDILFLDRSDSVRKIIMTDNLHEFEEQLQQEALASTDEVQFTADEYTVGGTLVRKDPDGTVFEFDPEKHAWFPKVPFHCYTC